MYPEQVQTILDDLVKKAEMSGMFSKTSAPSMDKEVFIEVVGKSALERFLSKDEIRWHPDEVMEMMYEVHCKSVIKNLMEEGLIDGIEDEHGEMVYWITDKGKEKALENLKAMFENNPSIKRSTVTI